MGLPGDLRGPNHGLTGVFMHAEVIVLSRVRKSKTSGFILSTRAYFGTEEVPADLKGGAGEKNEVQFLHIALASDNFLREFSFMYLISLV